MRMLMFVVAALGMMVSTAGADEYWITYEGNDLPENEGWGRSWGNDDGQYHGDGAVRTVENGILTMDSLYDLRVYDYRAALSAVADATSRGLPGKEEDSMFCCFCHRTLAAVLAAMLFAPTAAAQTTWHVDDDAPNDPGPGDPTISDPEEDGSAEHPFDAIQEAVNAADDADEVLVADGMYTGSGNKDLDFDAKAITVRSENGPETCIIDCEASWHDRHRGFCFQSAETPESVVEGFTITGASASEGGGVCCYGSSPTINNCVIVDNFGAWGGGIYCLNSGPVITDCTLAANRTDVGGGGIICRDNSNPTIANCVVMGNSANGAYGHGGGIFCYDCSSPTIANCTIAENFVGGIDCVNDSSPMITECLITQNVYGGITCNTSSNPTIANCRITQNFGGGVPSHNNSNPTICNCAIVANTGGRGAAVGCYNATATITNCLITRNAAGVNGGGIGGSPTITNSILWGNLPQEIADNPVVTYSDVQGGWEGDGNIDADPLFVDPDGPDDDPNTFEDNDYRLSGGSPCIDAADNTAVPPDVADLDGDGDTDEPIPFDLDGNSRFVDDPGMPDSGNGDPPIVDMGAYEFQGETCFGDLDGDNDVDWEDLAVLLDNYGTTSDAVYTDGDLDRDGDIDLPDLAALLSVYGTTCP